MEMIRSTRRLRVIWLVILVLLVTASLCPHSADARKTMQLPNKLARHSNRLKVKKQLSMDEISIAADSSNTQPYLNSPFSWPPFDSLPPNPSNSPPFCILPPQTPLPPSPTTTIPSPVGPIPTPDGPNPTPIGPTPTGPPSTSVPSPPDFGLSPSPPGSEVSPNPPGVGLTPSPPGSELSPSPPDVGVSPSPPGSELSPSPPYFEPSPPAGHPPSPTTYLPSPPTGPSYTPSPPSIFVPGPPVFQPPVVYPPPMVPPPRGGAVGALWCVVKPSVPDPIIQEAMNYACASGGDCGPIQPNGICFQPNTLFAHASYAFNSYWQRTKVAGGTCSFGGTAILVTMDPMGGHSVKREDVNAVGAFTDSTFGALGFYLCKTNLVDVEPISATMDAILITHKPINVSSVLMTDWIFVTNKTSRSIRIRDHSEFTRQLTTHFFLGGMIPNIVV